MNTPQLRIVPAPVEEMTSWRWEAFYAQVCQLRALQQLHKRTQDAAARRLVDKAETELDASIMWIAHDLGAPLAEEIEPAVLAVVVAETEGGVA